MEVKPTLVLITLTLLVNMVIADFFYNHPTINEEDVDGTRYKCVPGRTIVKVSEVKQPVIAEEETDSEEYRLRKGPSRRHHMKLPAKDETCKVCVCSAEGRDEYCSNRPADSINECLYLSDITSKFSMALPYEHANDLANRIRRVNTVGDVQTKRKCVPFISEYTNCNEDNTCSGCSRCTCNSDAQWVCQDVHECPQDNMSPDTGLRQDGDIFDNALEMLEYNMRKKKKYVPVLSSPRVPAPQMRAKADKDDILGYLVAVPRQEH